MKSNFSGFTLAEVLLTLLIIGVISSIVIPSLIQDTQKAELRAMIKKEYGIAQSAYNLSASLDNGGGYGPYSSGTTTSYTKFNAIKSKMNVIKSCDYGTGIFGNCWATGGVGKPDVYTTGCQQFTNSGIYQGVNTSFVAGDGSFWALYSYSTTTGADIAFVDVNGDKGPNEWGEDAIAFKMGDRILDLNHGCPAIKRNGIVVTDFRYLLLN
ncbi:MAG: prepilin-type N-terminal cleavage/methylation domain-containing protein [Candidatus Gastranaerophilales bacterium]|nr:prepilin-type N-terminal cleavage/methylation domain-containing protein [Candidatus Gastranaerophilales bacterium]